MSHTLHLVPAQPTLASIAPDIGDANGRADVVITGVGFTALPSALDLFRCRFDNEVQPAAPSLLNDTHAICTTTWGTEGCLLYTSPSPRD